MNRSVLRKSAGVVAAFFLGMSYFSPMQVQWRSIPDTMSLTREQLQSYQGGTWTVTATQDESLSDVGAASGEMVWSFLGLPLKKVKVEVSAEVKPSPSAT